MNAKYKHTQFGAWMFAVFLASGILIVSIALEMIAEGRLGSAIFMTCFYLLGVVLFYSFTIEISKRKLKFWFGIGVVRKSVLLSEIESTQEVVNPWYYFWGIKSIPGGWFYAIAPGPAVEILLKNGKIIHLGTDQPELLKQAIDSAK
ncbi:MAG: hypothetical protein HN736_16970 [Anaerolineae bacterium]|jgi:hypothetical protein|nr:hypothetical protein [Anaerolineae bacterium]MBT4310623.1 hypothetical protein [Anaerolineae bacterium]MBT4458362.1 hypothetical protein [Anaerolineae bacterium]MBT6322991.1 hypothetical protein [Anaerolineae bacterium]MBT6813223.1 hypothetical protein [Anaerolineae bacterium]